MLCKIRKTTAAVGLFLILSFVLVSLPEIGIVKASGTIYIRSDGSVEGTDKIQRNGNIYTFTSDISGSIGVQKSFITLEGSGYTLQGSGEYPERGIDLSNNRNTDPSRPQIVNVTIKNLRIVDFSTAIFCSATSNNTILSNYIAGCHTGIDVLGASNNLIKLNTFENNTNDIAISYSRGGNQVITQNNIDNFVQVWLSDQPIIDMNYWTNYNGTDSDGDGIGDTPYIIHENPQDNHPLMEPVPVIPEFPSWTPLLIMLLAVIAVAAIYKRKLQNQERRK